MALTRWRGSFDDASDDLIDLCARTWKRYLTPVEGDATGRLLQPATSKTGAYIYRGPPPLRLRFVVAMGRRPEGEKPQVVDVLPERGSGR